MRSKDHKLVLKIVVRTYSLCLCHFHMPESFPVILWQVFESQGSLVSSCEVEMYTDVSLKPRRCCVITGTVLSNLLVILDLHTGQLALFCLVLLKSFKIQNLTNKQTCLWQHLNISMRWEKIKYYLQNWWSHMVDTGAVNISKLEVTKFCR